MEAKNATKEMGWNYQMEICSNEIRKNQNWEHNGPKSDNRLKSDMESETGPSQER